MPVSQAANYIFGYTLENDVSDRGGRGDARYGSDWVVSKNHDTFAPLGPFITPKEFVPDPQKLKIRFTLNGQVMQEANTSFMIHTVFEQIAYTSNIMSLRPGDVIATGTPAGVGSARVPPVYFKPGDRSECTYDGIGTLRNPVVGSCQVRGTVATSCDFSFECLGMERARERVGGQRDARSRDDQVIGGQKIDPAVPHGRD